MPGPPDPAAMIRQQYPGWTLWVSGTGRWWASRTVELTAAEVAAGCVPFLHADDPGSLAGQIRAQDARRCQPAGTGGERASGLSGTSARVAACGDTP